MSSKKRVLLIGVYLLFIVIGLEGGARLVVALKGNSQSGDGTGIAVEDDTLGYKLKPGWKKGAISINSLGFRGKEFSVKKPAGVFRIVCVGNSITFGTDASSDTTTYPALVEKMLRERNRLGFPIEVINAGISGYTSYQCLQLLKSRIFEMSPDFVILCAGWNDITLAKVTGWHKALDGRLKKDVWSLEESFFVALVRNNILHSTPTVRPRRIQQFAENLAAMAELCKEADLPLAFLDPPTMYSDSMNESEVKRLRIFHYEVEEAPVFLAYRDTVTSVALGHGYPVFDSGLTYDVQGKENLLVDYCHPNDGGYVHMVNTLVPQIEYELAKIIASRPSHPVLAAD